MRKLPLYSFVLPALAFAQIAHAGSATLRGATTLEAPVVRLSDLFDDAGPASARILGPAPAPGNRIVVEAAQLAAIARQFGVDWRPYSQNDRAVLDRPGRALSRDTVIHALRDALSLLGTPTDLDIELPGFVAPLVPQEVEAMTSVDQLEYDGGTGRFTALLTVSAEGMAAYRERLSGRVSEMVDLPVLPRRIAAGVVLEPGDTRMTRVRADFVRGDVARVPAQLVGLALRRSLPAGQPVALADLIRPSTITKGSRIVIELRAPGLDLAVQGIALESGAIGERIQVLNPSTRATLTADIVGPQRVSVAPGTPAVPSAQSSALVAAR